MNKMLFLLTVAVILGGCSASSDHAGDEAGLQTPLTESGTQLFDAALAEELGADLYGMRLYVMAFLKAGPNQEMSAEQAAELQRGHMAHIRQLAEAGELILAGPFVGSADVRGIFLFRTDSVEHARTLTAQDPAVAAGRLEMELHQWYGSAALLQTPDFHARIARENP
ncbi:putative conserved protein YciI, contains a putative active-site phosphohistidine [Cyclonatronum proteinivorum]|uniref:Putative conserved protein YciI, contains a putative active-site phosphohistidine n=1 Tax=Cyclonatronum proteinivorum TaxID=1457365 RepID=A0A345UH87_9BACT|nr:YciI family protein [Cyclonatronum proteinivorum]AXI99838.1 putative conserved protein YciI, contains a putative active-site phosphohistidine [Cyclonatronum proteinivorum]